jgi:hypothetical protein
VERGNVLRAQYRAEVLAGVGTNFRQSFGFIVAKQKEREGVTMDTLSLFVSVVEY